MKRGCRKIGREESAMVRDLHLLPPGEIARRLEAAGFPPRSKAVVRAHIRRLGLKPHGTLAARAELKGLSAARMRELVAAGQSDAAIARLYAPLTGRQIWKLRRRWGIAAGGRGRKPGARPEVVPAPMAALPAPAVLPAAAPAPLPRTIWSGTLQLFLPDDEAVDRLYAGRRYDLMGRRLRPAQHLELAKGAA